MKVLVTGASGLLGSAVARAVISAGHHVRTFQRRPSGVIGAEDALGSITDTNAVAQAVAGMDAVIHLAAKVSFAGELAEFEQTNIEGTRKLLAASAGSSVGRFVFVSSPSVAHFGSSIEGAGAGAADPAQAHGNYARTKAAAELLALAADSPELAVVAVRPHIVWGPGDTQLVERVLDRARSGRLPQLGHGAALIDTTYVDNAADAMVAALEHALAAHGQSIVVSNGEPRPVGELVAQICAAGGVPAPRFSVPGRVARTAGAVVEAVWKVRPGLDEPPMTRFLAEQLSTAHWFDQRATREVLHWTPAVSLDEGMRRLAEYYSPRS
ncbi:MAG: NAD-dependent epimerase/dehydratase family protein [Acidobacteria bacterium]|nr:NAD-dependent epimerase/dehydratase family protein [Acidobacteriota bacterium]